MRVEIICSEVLCVPQSLMQDSTILKDIGSWDSLAHMILISRLEEEFKVEFSGDQIADIKSVGDIKAMLASVGVIP